jgi:hypothetical protein
MNRLSAIYSPTDNTLRVSPRAPVDTSIRERLEAAGFAWTPKAQAFVAPTWTPEREDVLIQLCGEIEDDDATLRQAPEVRAGRLRNFKAGRRKQLRIIEDAEGWLKAWMRPDLSLAQARLIAGFCHLPVTRRMRAGRSFWTAYDVLEPDDRRPRECPSMTAEQVTQAATQYLEKRVSLARRWTEHYTKRIAYETAMLVRSSGRAVDRPETVVPRPCESRKRTWPVDGREQLGSLRPA